MSKTLTPAVSYIRMSSDLQEASPDQQRGEVVKLATKHGYKIIREYFDEGISGDATEKRIAFLKMIRDAEEKGDFAAILCWDQDRFGRFDSIEAGRWIHPLRQVGVWLHTIAQGRIDWNDFTTRMMYGIQQEGKHQFLIDLSRNALRGRIAAAREGRLLVGSAYGYDRVFFDQAGKQVARVAFGEKFSKPSGWKVKLAPTEDPQERDIVKWLFDEFANSDCSLRSLVLKLNSRGVVTRHNGRWNAVTVRYILTNPVYLGHAVFGRRRSGKYHQVGDNAELLPSKGKGIGKNEKPIIVKNAHEPLVDLETFQRVKSKLRERADHKSRPRYSGYILTGVLHCGHCGRPMCGKTDGKKGRRYYYCPGIHNGGCPGYSLRQEELDHHVVGLVNQLFNSSKPVEKIKKAIHQREKNRPDFQQGIKTLKAKIDALDRKIAKGNENILLADPQAVPELSALLASWREERREAQESLETMAANPTGKTADENIKQALAQLKRLQQLFRSGNPMNVRSAVKAVVNDIQLWWEPNGKRYKRLARGILSWRSDEGLLKSDPSIVFARRPRESAGP
jgi:DNA invertase Pin-like site-specific DNA recombinase